MSDVVKGETRVQWGSHLEFILTLVGYAVGLGNVWRFPYLTYKNGGGAFLIPYVVCLFLIGIPIFALEVSLGQFSGQGPSTSWEFNPTAKGIGLSSVISCSCMMVYYNMIIAWGIRFLIASMTTRLPWEDCRSCNCLLYQQSFVDPDNLLQRDIGDDDFYNAPDKNDDQSIMLNDLLVNNSYGLKCTLGDESSDYYADSKSMSEVYFSDVLGKTSSISQFGEIQWTLVACYVVSFVIVFLVLTKGVASLGKVVYFTAIFPYILLTIFLVRTATLDGAGNGIRFYLKPDLSKIIDPVVWSDAAIQIFFSLSACQGGLIAMSSYNNFNNNVIRDSIVVPVINCLTSFFAGFVVFSTLGFMANIKNTSVEEVTTQGPGLIFVVYPEAFTQMSVAPLWSCLFFLMVCILGLSTLFSVTETIMTSIVDQFPHALDSQKKVTILRLIVMLSSCILAVPLYSGSGLYWLDLIDSAAMGYTILLVGLLEVVVIIYLYGYSNFEEDIRCMVGFRPNIYFRVCWSFVTPLLILCTIIFKIVGHKSWEPDWVNAMYILIMGICLFPIPGWWFYYTCTHSELSQYTTSWRNHREQSERTSGRRGSRAFSIISMERARSSSKGFIEINSEDFSPDNADESMTFSISNQLNAQENTYKDVEQYLGDKTHSGINFYCDSMSDKCRRADNTNLAAVEMNGLQNKIHPKNGTINAGFSEIITKF